MADKEVKQVSETLALFRGPITNITGGQGGSKQLMGGPRQERRRVKRNLGRGKTPREEGGWEGVQGLRGGRRGRVGKMSGEGSVGVGLLECPAPPPEGVGEHNFFLSEGKGLATGRSHGHTALHNWHVEREGGVSYRSAHPSLEPQSPPLPPHPLPRARETAFGWRRAPQPRGRGWGGRGVRASGSDTRKGGSEEIEGD